MELEKAYNKIDNLCCMAFNENNDIVDNKEYPDDQDLCHGVDDMVDALETFEQVVNLEKELGCSIDEALSKVNCVLASIRKEYGSYMEKDLADKIKNSEELTQRQKLLYAWVRGEKAS